MGREDFDRCPNLDPIVSRWFLVAPDPAKVVTPKP